MKQTLYLFGNVNKNVISVVKKEIMRVGLKKINMNYIHLITFLRADGCRFQKAIESNYKKLTISEWNKFTSNLFLKNDDGWLVINSIIFKNNNHDKKRKL